MDVIDRDISGVDHVSGLSHDMLMKNDPIWASLRSEMSALQALVIELKVQHNALAVATSHASLVAVSADPAL